MAIVFNSSEINNKETQQTAETQHDITNGLDNTTEISGNQPEIEQQTAETQHDITNGTAVVKYIGTGIWLDQDGKKWGRDDIAGTNIKNVRQYPLHEYNKREDLKFMVSYGAMEVNIVKG